MRNFFLLRKFFVLSLSLLALAALLLPAGAEGQTRDFTRWVNPFIGTGGHGHTFPGAVMPFGMVQLSPDTRTDNWDGSSGYHYSDDVIYGFSHTHLSGTGIPDGADILLMPKLDDSLASSGTYESKFSHINETAEPGYYSVKLDGSEIFAELTATKRVGLHRYTFPLVRQASFVLDLNWRDKVLDSDVKITANNRIEGFRRSSSWSKDQAVYFVMEFSKPLKYKTLIVSEDLPEERSDGTRKKANLKSLFKFDIAPREQILVKVAISYVSIEGARKNLEAELPGWDFDKVRADAKAAWNKELSRIEVSGGTEEQTTNFYTALYHTMIHPGLFNDVDGRYRGHDGKVHQLPGYADEPPYLRQAPANYSEQYTVFSLWDTFRAAHPLYSIIDRRRTADYINSFIRIYEQGGRLPVWELWGEETDTMIGYHAVPVIADAMAKGIEGFDYDKAYQAAKHSANLDHFGLAGYKSRGFVSTEDDNESVSKTLEYAYDDWCIAQMASVMQRRRPKDRAFAKDYENFSKRSRYFENLFDPRVGFFVPKKNGGFIRPFAPNEVTFYFTEGNSWQYSFFVPHDVNRLIELMGGREDFAAKLWRLFNTEQQLTGRNQPDITGLIGQYAHGNEPSHHIPYLFAYAGLPWATQKYVRKIMDEFYKNSPDGLIGNEDAGQMSAWYVMSASGFYQVAPGLPVYTLGTPIFPKVTFNLENGRAFTINASPVSAENIYIRSAKLNGRPLNRAFITNDEIMRGGRLDFSMDNKPNDAAFSEYPVSRVSLDSVAAPEIDGLRVFRDQNVIFMRTLTPRGEIYYTLDGSEPTPASAKYLAPLRIDKTTAIKAFTAVPGGNRSSTVEAYFARRENDWRVISNSGYSLQYTGGGDEGIVDGLRGNKNFASGEWQGYHGRPFEAVIDLQRETEIKSIGGSFLQSARSWIWMPSQIVFEASPDGVNFTKISDIRTDVSVREMNSVIREFRSKVSPVRARFIRVRAANIGKIPDWHAGAGGEPWIFVDEIIIN